MMSDYPERRRCMSSVVQGRFREGANDVDTNQYGEDYKLLGKLGVQGKPRSCVEIKTFIFHDPA